MKHILIKFFSDYEKEEKYLNEMSAKGLALIDFFVCRYVFEDTIKSEYVYRIELLEKSIKHPESQKYIKFMEENGIEFVASSYNWVYFRKKAVDGEFNIYSDIDSKIKHYKRVRKYYLFVIALFLFTVVLNINNLQMNTIIELYLFTLFLGIFSAVMGIMLFIFQVLPLSKKIKKLIKEKDIME